jgi:hypothetical protein
MLGAPVAKMTHCSDFRRDESGCLIAAVFSVNKHNAV